MKPACASFVLFATAVQAQSIHDLFGTDTFRRAFIDANTNEVTFEPFQELHWEAHARAALAWLNLGRPTPPQIARPSTFARAGPEFRSVDFPAPLDRPGSRATYRFRYAPGLIPRRP